MDISGILSRLDEAFNAADTEGAERIITEGIKQSVEEGDDGSLLQLLNEYLGFLRETGRSEESFAIAEEIEKLSERMGLFGSIPHATSVLNIANAYRAGGRLHDSLKCYDEVEAIYQKSVPGDSMLFASFYNNKALLYQEMGDFNEAIASLNKALSVVEKKGESFEIAVTHANLSNAYLGLNDYVLAEKEALEAKKIFEESGNLDSHYASALYTLGVCRLKHGDVLSGRKALTEARSIMEKFLGKNEFYYRISDALTASEDDVPFVKGMEIARAYYEECFKPVIKEKFPEYENKIAAGLVGRGSDCYGYDDAFSKDHDYGPGFCVFVSKEIYDEIGEKLEEVYENLPKEFRGLSAAPRVSRQKRRGIFIIEDFYKDLLGMIPAKDEDYLAISDYALSAAVNGEVFEDPVGRFTEIREMLKQGYPESVLYLKLAQSMSVFSQTAQYNYGRFKSRNDNLTAAMMLSDGLREAMRIAHYLEG